MKSKEHSPNTCQHILKQITGNNQIFILFIYLLLFIYLWFIYLIYLFKITVTEIVTTRIHRFKKGVEDSSLLHPNLVQ